MTSISDELLEAMLAACEKATPGPWSSVEGHSRIAIDGPKDKSIGLIGMTDYWDRFSAEDQANAAHIANCDPGTIAALITELQALRRTSHEGVREAVETQQSIGAWADEVFGPVTDLPRAVGRAGEELAELKEAAEALTPQDMIVEMADVVIVLMRLANAIGQDLNAAIDAKMAINRKRVWKSDGTGHGYHVKAALADGGQS